MELTHAGILENSLWDDLQVTPPAGINPTGGASAMTVIADANGYLGCLQADAVNETCVVNFQIPHTYQIGTDIHPHIHVVRNDGADNTGTVEFTARFRHIPLQGDAGAWVSGGAGATSIQPADGANKTGLIYWVLSDATYHIGISDIIICDITRSGVTTGSVAITSADIHGQLGQAGSRQEGVL